MPTILVIENNPNFRRQLIDWLTLKNFLVIDADSGIAGLRLMAKQPPDLVICNLHLGEMNGLSVLQAIRYNPLTSQTPFLLMASSSEQNVDQHPDTLYRQARQLQANGCLEKSRIWSQLVGALKSCLKRPLP